ncbi:MAG TPA: DegT/DnrJ/EryC1/StrS family aminotransferase [Thermoleophilaceae bacterium]|jgi:dTDP-4-amino-4,6-dideoxygalactose transaminase
MTEPPLIPLFDVQLGPAELDAVADTLRSGWLTQGPRTEAFEAAFAGHLGARHVVATSSCTAALHLAYLAAGVGPGDEVIVPAITFVATANAARYCGATPVLADIRGAHDLGIDPDDVERRLTERTRAVCAVHYGGYPAALGRLSELCERAGVALIEDAAHSPSASTADGARLGTVGLAGAFSFFSNKVLSCGEGGALATESDEVAALARSLRSHAMTSGTWDRHRGRSSTYDVTGLGFNYRMDEPRAALLTARLAGLEDDIAARRRIVHRYRAALEHEDGVVVPYTDAEVELSSCYVMPVVLDEPELRDPLRQLLLDRHRVQTSVLYPAIHEFSAYEGEGLGPLPQSELVARAQLTLPLYPHLSEDDQDRVVAALSESLRSLRRAA